MKARTRISKFGKTCNYILAILHFIAIARLYVGRTQAGKFYPKCPKKRASGTFVPTCSNSMWKFTVCNYKITLVVSVRILYSSQQAHPLSQTCRHEITAQNTVSAHFLQRGCDSNESSATVFVINNCSFFPNVCVLMLCDICFNSLGKLWPIGYANIIRAKIKEDCYKYLSF